MYPKNRTLYIKLGIIFLFLFVPVTSFAQSSLQGDLNSDGRIDIFDYNILVSNYGNTTCGNIADINGNCRVDIFDYNILVTNYGRISTTATPTPGVSPCLGPRLILSGTVSTRYTNNSALTGTIFDRTSWYSNAVGNGTNGAFSIGDRTPPPNNLCVYGGVINGHIDLSWTWDQVHTFGGYGDQTYVGNVINIQKSRVHNVEDGWKPRELPDFGNTGVMQISGTYMTGIRDDSIENDDFMPGYVEDSLFDGVDTFLSEQNQSGTIPNTLGTNEDPYIRINKVYVRLYSTNSSGNSNPGRWFKWQPRGTVNHKLIITDSVFATHGPSPRDGWSALNFPTGTQFMGTNYILWLGPLGGYKATVPAGVIFLEGQGAADKWNQTRNNWLTQHGYNPKPQDDWNPMDDPVVAPR